MTYQIKITNPDVFNGSGCYKTANHAAMVYYKNAFLAAQKGNSIREQMSSQEASELYKAANKLESIYINSKNSLLLSKNIHSFAILLLLKMTSLVVKKKMLRLQKKIAIHHAHLHVQHVINNTKNIIDSSIDIVLL